jgi:hypothetical protein
MDEVASTARLVDEAALAARGRTLTATLPRSEVQSALEDGEFADLILEVARIDGTLREDRALNVAWDRDDLEALLGRTEGDQIALTFDEAELELVFETADVEAQGLRGKAAVLSVAAATALGGASLAGASTVEPGDGSLSSPGTVTMVTDTLSGGQPGAVAGFSTDAGTQPSDAVAGMVTDTGTEATRTPEATVGDSGGISIADGAPAGALAGGVALLITAAAFVTRGQRRTERPA